jgi:hypothetical protein
MVTIGCLDGPRQEEAMGKMTLLVGQQKDGYVFRLKPSSKKDLLQERDSPDLVSSVFISYDTKHDFEQIHGPVWDHIISLLTGLSLNDLNRVGGFAVVDPGTGQTLFDSVGQHV